MASPSKSRVEVTEEELLTPMAATLSTEIHLSVLKYAELVQLAQREAKNEDDRLSAILKITKSSSEVAVKKTKITTLLMKWNYVHRTTTTAVAQNSPQHAEVGLAQ